MAAPPRSFPIPRGQLSLGLQEFFANQVMTGAASVTAAAGFFAQVGLVNNSTLGNLLHVIGLSCWSSDVAGGVIMRMINLIPGNATITPGVPLNPMVGALDGQVLTINNGAHVGGNAIWRLCGNAQPDFWAYDAPVAIVPPGWAFYTDSDNINTTVSAAFRWLVLKL